MTDHEAYFSYLRSRSRLGLLYRTRYLYPRLCRDLHGRVLDIGCGIGDMLRYRPNTIGVDVNAAAVAWCREHGLPAIAMEPDRLPFDAGAFDGAILDNVLEHLRSPLPLLAEVRRVVRQGGNIVAGVPGRRGYASDPDHKVFYDQRALIALMTDAGFRVQRIRALPFKSAILDRRMRQYCWYGTFSRD